MTTRFFRQRRRRRRHDPHARPSAGGRHVGSHAALRDARRTGRRRLKSCSATTRRWRSGKGASANPRHTLREVLEFEKALSLQIERLGPLRLPADLRRQLGRRASRARGAARKSAHAHRRSASSFVAPEIQAIDDATFERFLADPALAEWVIAAAQTAPASSRTRSRAAEERLLALGPSALRGHGETFSQLTNVDMKFGMLADEKGVERELSQSSFSSFLVKRDADAAAARVPAILRRV